MICRKCARDLPADAVYCCYCGVNQTVRKQNAKSKGNGTGSIYKAGDRPGWIVAWTVDGYVDTDETGAIVVKSARKKKGGFKTKRAANEYLSALISGREKEIAKAVPSVADVYAQFVNAPGKKPGASTMTAYKTAFTKRINPTFGNIPINAVSLHHLEKAIAGLTYDPAKDVKDLMSKLFQRAMADGQITTNPATLLALPEKCSKEIPAWLPGEIESLWKAYGQGNRIAAACLLMIYTGMMPGELFALKRDMIDASKKTIVGCGLKTKERREKPIVLSDAILPVLDDLASTSTSTKGFVLGMNRDNFYDAFGQLKKDLSIREEVRPYSSRHSTATELELLGVSPSVIASVLRHKNYATTAKHYMDISTDKALEAVEKIKLKPESGSNSGSNR